MAKVTFSKPRPARAAGEVNVRTVYVDGVEVGRMFGTEPAFNGSTRPTCYEYVPTGAEQPVQMFSRIEEARRYFAQR